MNAVAQDRCPTCDYKSQPKVVNALEFSVCAHVTDLKEYGTKAMSMQVTNEGVDAGDYSNSLSDSFSGD